METPSRLVGCDTIQADTASDDRKGQRKAPKRLVFWFAVVAVLAVTAAGCGSDGDDTTGAHTGTDTTAVTTEAENEGEEIERFNDPTDTIEVAVGQTFQITLTPDAADCFSWDLNTTDSDVVSLMTSRPSAITGVGDDPAFGGAANLDVYEFTADTAGSVTLEFTEISQCEPGDTRDTRSIPVEVVDAN